MQHINFSLLHSVLHTLPLLILMIMGTVVHVVLMPKAKFYRYSMRIYKYSMRFGVPALDQSDCNICYSYDLTITKTKELNYFSVPYISRSVSFSWSKDSIAIFMRWDRFCCFCHLSGFHRNSFPFKQE